MMSGRLARAFRVNLRNVITSPNFAISVLLVFGVLLAEIAEDAFGFPWKQAYGDGLGDAYFFNISIHFGYYIYAAPLACAFAASGLFCADAEGGFYRLRLLKSGRRAYKYGLFLGATVGGGLALMAGVALFGVVCSLVYLPYTAAAEMAALDAWMPLLLRRFANWHYMLAHAGLAFLFGMVWSGVGLLFSLFSPARYVSYLAPFIVCFSSVLVLPASLQPPEMLVQMNWTTFTFPKLLAYQAVLYGGVLVVFARVFERRVLRGQG